jgi:hypothetical protein
MRKVGRTTTDNAFSFFYLFKRARREASVAFSVVPVSLPLFNGPAAKKLVLPSTSLL